MAAPSWQAQMFPDIAATAISRNDTTSVTVDGGCWPGFKMAGKPKRDELALVRATLVEIRLIAATNPIIQPDSRLSPSAVGRFGRMRFQRLRDWRHRQKFWQVVVMKSHTDSTTRASLASANPRQSHTSTRIVSDAHRAAGHGVASIPVTPSPASTTLADRWLTPAEAANNTGFSFKTLRRRAESGLLVAFRSGGAIRYRKTDLDRMFVTTEVTDADDLTFITGQATGGKS